MLSGTELWLSSKEQNVKCILLVGQPFATSAHYNPKYLLSGSHRLASSARLNTANAFCLMLMFARSVTTFQRARADFVCMQLMKLKTVLYIAKTYFADILKVKINA